MAFVRRFCTSSGSVSELGHHRTTRRVSRGLACTYHPSCTTHSPLVSTTISGNRGGDGYTQHVYFSKLRPTEIGHETGMCRSDPTESRACQLSRSALSRGRWHSLHWDRRETSLMCLKDSNHCCSAVPRPPELSQRKNSLNGDDCEFADLKSQEPPVLFSMERSTINHIMSTVTSTLPVQDSLKDITSALHRLSATMHVQSIFEMVAKPWDEECSDDIIIRNNQPIKCHRHDGTIKCTIRHHDFDFINQPSNQLRVTTQSPKFLESDRKRDLQQEMDIAQRRHLYFNKLYHLPMVATVPQPSPLQSSADDCQPVTARADPSVPEHNGDVSPRDNGDQRPSKEQILAMYERLAKEMPIFLHESHDFSMYASTVEFDNRIMKFKTKGLTAYKASVQGLKYLCAAYMTGSSMEVLRITAELELRQIHARWRIKGVPVHSYIIRPWRRKHRDRYFDAFSTFELGTDGLIHRHKMDKVMPTPSDKVRAPSIATRIGIALGLVRNPAMSPNCMVPKPPLHYASQDDYRKL